VNNAAIKTRRYTLKIVRDTDPPDPREDEDRNFGKMVCFHHRYVLGDNHDYSDSDAFLASLVRAAMSNKEIISHVKSGQVDDMSLSYDRSNREWILSAYSRYFDRCDEINTYRAPLDNDDKYPADDILESMPSKDLLVLAERSHLILPLYLSHSGVTISTSDFNDTWDSGKIGYIFVSLADVAFVYGDTSPDNIQKALECLNDEVRAYNSYMRGECYGFQLFKDGVEQDSCWGFLGGYDEAKQAILGYIPEEVAALVDDASYGEDDPEYAPGDEPDDEIVAG
jgi:hypothetical protein